MKVNIETADTHQHIRDIEMDGTTFIFSERPTADLEREMFYVYGDGYRKAYYDIKLMELPSVDDKFRCKFIATTPVAESIANIENALIEIYELILGGGV